VKFSFGEVVDVFVNENEESIKTGAVLPTAKCSYGKAIVQRIKECAVLPTAKCSYGKAIVQLQLR